MRGNNNSQIKGIKTGSRLTFQPGLSGTFPLTCRDQVHVLAGSMQQQPLEACSPTQTSEKTCLLRLDKSTVL